MYSLRRAFVLAGKTVAATTCKSTHHGNLATKNPSLVFKPHRALICTSPVNFSVKAKSKGSKDKKHKTKVVVNEAVLAEVVDYKAYKEELDSFVNDMKTEFIQHLTLRNATGSLEQFKVKHFSKEYEIQEIAEVVRKNPKTIILNMDAFPHLIPIVVKALNESGMNLNPQLDGTAVIIPIPKITQEHRENLAKNAKVLFNKYYRKAGDLEANYVKNVKKNPNKLSEDLIYNVSQQLVTMSTDCKNELKTLFMKKHVELVGK